MPHLVSKKKHIQYIYIYTQYKSQAWPFNAMREHMAFGSMFALAAQKLCYNNRHTATRTKCNLKKLNFSFSALFLTVSSASVMPANKASRARSSPWQLFEQLVPQQTHKKIIRGAPLGATCASFSKAWHLRSIHEAPGQTSTGACSSTEQGELVGRCLPLIQFLV